MAQPRLERGLPVTASAVFDPPLITPGGRAIYRVTLNALEEAIEWPETLLGDSRLSLREGARGQLLQMAGTNMEAKTSFLYHAQPAVEGRFKVPEFTIRANGQEVRVPAAELTVSALVPPGVRQPLRIYIEPPPGPFYVGQAIRPRVLLPFSFGAIQTLTQVTYNGQDFLVDQGASRPPRIEPLPQRGSNLLAFIYEPLITPIASGAIRFSAQGWSLINRTVIPATPTNQAFSMEISQTLVDSDPVELVVKPLPPRGDLAGFTGAIGMFTNDPPKLSTNAVRVGDPIKLRVTFRGDGNVARLVPPPAPQSADWQVFEASGDPTPPNILAAQGAITFTYTLVPLKHGVLTTPPIPWGYFDPQRGAYTSLQIAPLRVMVTPGPYATAPEVFAEAATNQPGLPPQPKLSGLAPAPGATLASLDPVQTRPWFPIVQALPAFLFVGLWQWDRRRRFHARHPEIALRRRARRELRRHRRRMRSAAQRRDAPAFAHSAVEALRSAVAPHYPATPHALVGSDVVGILGESEAVRRVFALTDAARFAGDPTEITAVLALRTDLENALEKLDRSLASVGPAPTGTTAPATAVLMLLTSIVGGVSASSTELFHQATNAYHHRDYAQAADSFRALSIREPSTGTFQNLGSSEWQLGHVGEAVLAWEQALWIDPYNQAARNNLSFARLTAQLETPELTWYELISTWLPLNAWPWIAGGSLWLAVGMVLLPGILGQTKAAWHQAVAAVSLMIFLLSLPAQFGIQSRRSLGFVLGHETELRLTPTREAQILSRLSPGDPVRFRRDHGSYILVRTSRYTGWVLAKELGFICP